MRFREVTGLAVVLLPSCSPNRPIRIGRQETDFCRLVWNEQPGGCKDCSPTQQELFRRLESKLKPQCVCCAAGMMLLAVPVVAAGKHIATVYGGKVRTQPANEREFRGFVQRLGLQRNGVAWRELRMAYFQVPLLPPARLRAALRLLDLLGRLFGEALAKLPTQVAATESPHVARAKALVQSSLGERLTTEQVAKALRLNSSYFCRLFHRCTGMTFHAYLAQSRVEAVKSRLLNSPSSITEICYVAGFQSVSDFNRVFKSKVGTSPTQFRREAKGKNGG